VIFSLKTSTQDDRQLASFLIIATIPAAGIAFFAGDTIEFMFRAPLFIGINFILWGIVLWLSDWYARRYAHRRTEDVTLRDALLIGTTQVLALIPGTSRSGITITAGMFSGFEKKSATELSFLMSVPIIALAGGHGVMQLISHGLNGMSIPPLLIGFCSAALGGFAAIWGLIGIIKRWSFTPFVMYRLIVGILILMLLA
jgi:undecaprenyl-diphosphatase